MTLATASDTPALARTGRLPLSLDALLMAASFAACMALFAHGGLEALLFAAAGAGLGARNAVRGVRLRGAYSGGFAGLFVGALFAAFFHEALVELIRLFLT